MKPKLYLQALVLQYTGLTSVLYTVFSTLLSKRPVLSWAKAGKDVKIKRKKNQFFYFSSVSSIRKITCHFSCAEWFNPIFFRREGRIDFQTSKWSWVTVPMLWPIFSFLSLVPEFWVRFFCF